MKCPVCDQENSTLLCSQCGFDASRDYTLHPTFGPVGRVPSVSAKKKQWLDSQKKSAPSPNGPQFVDYRKMVTQAAEEDLKKRTSQEHKLMLELQFARDQVSTLKREQKILTDSLIPENQQLKERILSLVNETEELNDALSKARNEIKELNKALREARNEVSALKREKDKLQQNLGHLRNRNGNLGKQKNELMRKITELEAALEAERNKGLETPENSV